MLLLPDVLMHQYVGTGNHHHPHHHYQIPHHYHHRCNRPQHRRTTLAGLSAFEETGRFWPFTKLVHSAEQVQSFLPKPGGAKSFHGTSWAKRHRDSPLGKFPTYRLETHQNPTGACDQQSDAIDQPNHHSEKSASLQSPLLSSGNSPCAIVDKGTVCAGTAMLPQHEQPEYPGVYTKKEWVSRCIRPASPGNPLSGVFAKSCSAKRQLGEEPRPSSRFWCPKASTRIWGQDGMGIFPMCLRFKYV